MAPFGDVVMRGWFPKAAALRIMSDRPPCHIAISGDPLPSDVIAGMQAQGHSAIIMSRAGTQRTTRSGQHAEDICRVALGYAAASVSTPRSARAN